MLILSTVFSLGVFAQEITLSGVVTSADDNQPLPGVTVVVKGTTNGTVTNFDGAYTLNIASDAILQYSFVGMKQQEISVDGRSQINVALEADAFDVEEVVVVGYGVQKKALTTGANLNVKGEDIAEMNTGSAMEALQGVAAGISITRNNGAPGAGTRVTIRGLGTIGNSNPLYIVDGVAVGDIDYLSPSDIESIDVLKDAASAAIYGSRAANGVVLVTTVKGKKGRPAQITYDAYYGVQNIYKNLDPLTAQEYMYIMDEGRVNDGLAPNNWEAMLKNNNWLNNTFDGDLGTQLGEQVWNDLQNGWEGTNWINEMTNSDAAVQSHALNITGGSEDINYSMGISYFDQKSMIGGDISDAGYKRMTARLNTQMVLKKNDEHAIVTVGENFTYTNTENRSPRTGNIYWNDLHNALVQHPLMPAYWQPAIDNNINQFGFTPTMDGINQHTNPIASMFYATNYNYGKGNKVIGNVFAELEPIKDLKIRSSYGIDAWFGHGRSMNPTYALGTLYTDDVDGASQNQYFGNNWTWTTTVSYERLFGDHKVSGLLGYELLQNQISTEVSGSRNNLLFPGDPRYAYINNTKGPSSINDINTSGADWSAGGGGIMSYIARAQYNYLEKYIVAVTMRADGSSNFAKDNRWGYFPSISAGWVMTSEDFMQDVDILDFAKLRASWGQNGNQSIDNFIYSSQIAYVFPGYFFGDTKPVSGTTAYPAKVPNPDVTWETSEQLNIGFDARLLDSRLGVTFDWYKKTTKDWLLVAPILGTAGAGAPFVNGGDIQNSGVELVVNWNDNIGEFKYGVSLSGAHNKNEVTRIANTDGIIQGPSHVLSQGTASVSRVEVGQPIGFFYGFKTDGILQNQDEVDAYVTPDGAPYFNDQRPGDVRFVDQNMDGVIDEDDKMYLGNPNPDFEMGLHINLEYKGVYLNTTLAGKFGMQVMQSYRSFADNFTQNYTSSVFDRWHGEGTSTTMPRLTYGSNRNQQYISDIYMHNADYLRINNLTIGYNFGKLLSDFEAISSLKVYAAVNNLYTFTKYDGMDPEVRFGHDAGWASGIDLGLYPSPRTVMFGLSVAF